MRPWPRWRGANPPTLPHLDLSLKISAFDRRDYLQCRQSQATTSRYNKTQPCIAAHQQVKNHAITKCLRSHVHHNRKRNAQSKECGLLHLVAPQSPSALIDGLVRCLLKLLNVLLQAQRQYLLLLHLVQCLGQLAPHTPQLHGSAVKLLVQALRSTGSSPGNQKVTGKNGSQCHAAHARCQTLSIRDCEACSPGLHAPAPESQHLPVPQSG